MFDYYSSSDVYAYYDPQVLDGESFVCDPQPFHNPDRSIKRVWDSCPKEGLGSL